MVETIKEHVRELPYQAYQDRQFMEISPEYLQMRMDTMRPGGRAAYERDSGWQPLPYPGFAFQAMAPGTPANHGLIGLLSHLRNQLIAFDDQDDILYPLPDTSYHQTVANTFSADRLQRNVIAHGILQDFPSILKCKIRHTAPALSSPPVMRLIGLSFFRTAIGILGTFDSPNDYQRILNFREKVYEQSQLEEIGLVRTRPFIGHLTLAYLEKPLDNRQKQQLLQTTIQINQDIAGRNLLFHMPEARLHQYDNLSGFQSRENYPAYRL